eukprot:TRINITY_DN62533_c0_g1_i1.p1 TRINITY_DN62533_c0_g1~~TRINITY_DN62533_c0_g1_i1.p1  ORF type:complete len:251 (+),score=32.04 TRINITY_DN62533_c0_g1_i1:94-846(+)
MQPPQDEKPPTSSLARGAELRRRRTILQEQVEKSVAESVDYGKMCIAGFVALWLVRLGSIIQRILPNPATLPLHWANLISDLVSLLASTAFIFVGPRRKLTEQNWLSVLLTCVVAAFVMNLLSTGYLYYVTIFQPKPPAWAPLWDRMVLVASIWDASALASVGFSFTSVVTSFRIYRELRIVGLYPSMSNLIARGKKLTHVSALEVVCEESDLALLKSCGCSNVGQTQEEDQELIVLPGGRERGEDVVAS